MIKRYWLLIALLAVAPLWAEAQNLQDYIDRALEDHPRLNAVEAERKSALERAEKADALPDPKVTAGVFLFPVETRVGPQRGTVSAMQQFPWFGTLEAQKGVHLAEARTEEVELQQQRLLLERSLRKAYADLYHRHKKVYWQRQLIESLRSIERLAEAAYSRGNGSMADVVRIQIEREEAEFQVEDLKDRKSSLVARFNNLMHRPPDSSVQLPDTLMMDPPDSSDGNRWENHPKYQKFQRKQAEWEAKQDLTDKERKPSFGLGMKYIVTAEREITELEDNGRDAFLPMLQISLPIWSKKYDHKQEALRYKAEAVRHRQEAWKDDWHTKIEEARYAMNRARKRYELLNEQIDNTRRASRLLKSAYRNANADIDEVLRMENRLIEYKKEQIEQVVQFKKSQAEWKYLIVNY